MSEHYGIIQSIWKAIRQLNPDAAVEEAERRICSHESAPGGPPPDDAKLAEIRKDVARRIVREVSRENALSVIATALGDVIPSVFAPLIGVAEAAGDTAVLTANQVRMLFLLGAVHGRRTGYSAQWREIASIVGAAFGWRSIARNLIGKIPFGGGLVPKGAVAYAGTMVVGEGLIFYYTTGRRMTRAEMKEAFSRAYCDAVRSVKSLVGRADAESPGSGSVPD